MFRGARLLGLSSSVGWSGAALGLDTGCAGGVERSATSSTCVSVYRRECTTARIHLTKGLIGTDPVLHFKRYFNTLKPMEETSIWTIPYPIYAGS